MHSTRASAGSAINIRRKIVKLETVMAKRHSDVQVSEPGALEKREVFEQVGRAIVHLSDIENLLASIFHSLVLPKAPSPSMELFYDQGGFEKKMKLVDYIFHLEGSKEELERWKKIAAELEEHRPVRNLIAHYGMYVDSWNRDGNIDVSLHPPWLKGRPDKERKYLRVAEIGATASALDKIRADLVKLDYEIDETFMPKHLRDDCVSEDEEE
jgi:hypothetical protein